MTDDDDLTDAERRALAALAAETPLRAGFEDRVVDGLVARGLLTRTAPPLPARRRRTLVELGLAAGLFGAGFGTAFLARRGEPDGSLYLLLLYPGPRFAEGDEQARVSEYAAWAQRLRRAGQLVSAERLGDGGSLLPADAAVAPPVPQGFFLIRARDSREADAIARGCPHLAHGGVVAVHAVARA
jgi:hypothetical protein